MANEPIITIVGNTTAAPELRSTGSGRSVSNVTIASTPRSYNKQSGQWEDGEPLFIRASIWNEMAVHAEQSISKGDRVIATGRLKQSVYEKDGQRRTSLELDVDEIGPSLRFATATVTRQQGQGGAVRSTSGSGQQEWTGDPNTSSQRPSGSQGDTSMWDTALTPSGTTETPF